MTQLNLHVYVINVMSYHVMSLRRRPFMTVDCTDGLVPTDVLALSCDV